MRKGLKKIKKEADKRCQRRRLAIRKKVVGSAECPRICAQRSNKHIAVQVVDDVARKTLFCVQTYGKNKIAGALNNREGAKLVGKVVAEKMKGQNLEKAVFDRVGLSYTGVLAVLADTIRENGIKI